VFLDEMVVPYEDDEVTRLIIDSHDRLGFQRISHLTVGGLRDWLLDADAARVIAGLVAGARRLGRSGVDLKDTSRADELRAAATLTLE
jgi:ethanolamine ammonia-lyase large subunit